MVTMTTTGPAAPPTTDCPAWCTDHDGEDEGFGEILHTTRIPTPGLDDIRISVERYVSPSELRECVRLWGLVYDGKPYGDQVRAGDVVSIDAAELDTLITALEHARSLLRRVG